MILVSQMNRVLVSVSTEYEVHINSLAFMFTQIAFRVACDRSIGKAHVHKVHLQIYRVRVQYSVHTAVSYPLNSNYRLWV